MQVERDDHGRVLVTELELDAHGRLPKAQLFEWGRWIAVQTLPDGRPFERLLCVFADEKSARAHHQTLRFVGAWACFFDGATLRSIDDEVCFDVRADADIRQP